MVYIIETSIERISATGIDNQMPLSWKIKGSVDIEITINAKVLKKDNIAEIFPFERAVNIPDIKMLNPMNKKDIENNFIPSVAILNTLLL